MPSARYRVHLIVAVLGLLGVVACGSDDDAPAATATASTTAPVTSTGAAAGFPVSIDSCGEAITFEAPPGRVVILGSAPVSLLASVGALERVVAKTGDIANAYYDAETTAMLDAIPTLISGTGNTGGVEISQEAIIDQEPDLVIGYETETITRAGLRAAGISLYVIPAFCPEGSPGGDGEVGFDDVYAEVSLYGAIFGAPDEAAAVVDELRARVDAATATLADVPERRGAALYLAADGTTLFAYGPAGMAHPQMAAIGVTNVFGDVSDRVFEVSTEELLDRDPELIVMLYGDEMDPEAIEDSLRALPGADALTAVADDQILMQPFQYTDPPNPLSVTGLERMAERFGPP